MPASSRSVPRALSVLSLALAACGPSPEASQVKPTAEPVKPATSAAVAEAPAPTAGPHLTANPPAADAADPPWFSPALLPKAAVTKKGRSPADDQGRFTAQILFAFPAGASMSECTEPLAAALAKVVPEVKREEKDGRVTLTGDTEAQHVMFMCGEAKGTLTAFVSYRWTQPPPAAQ